MSKLRKVRLFSLTLVSAVALSDYIASSASAAPTVGVNSGVFTINVGLLDGLSLLSYEISPNVVVRRQSSGTLDAQTGCAQVTSNKVRCARSSVSSVSASLSGEQDTFAAGPIITADDGSSPGTSLPITVNGNGGNDALTGGNLHDHINGGLGDDLLRGLGGADVFDGGSGADVATYSTATTGVTLTLDGLANDGAAGENDLIGSSVEGAVGTFHHDVITGNSGDNELRGQGTATTPAQASDTISGAGGNDFIDARGAKPDTVSCGLGNDTALLDLVDAIPGDCENISQAALGQHPNVSIRSRARVGRRGAVLRVRLACPRKAHRRCKGTLSLRDRAGRRLGRRHFSIRRGGARVLTVGLNLRGRRAVAAHRRINAVAKETDTNGKPKTTIARLRVR